jgi:endonuclease I
MFKSVIYICGVTVFIRGYIHMTNQIGMGTARSLEKFRLMKNPQKINTSGDKRYYSTFIEKCVNPQDVRNMIYEDITKNYKYLTYPKAKNVLHKYTNMLDLYGDKVENMNVEHVFPQYAFKNDNRKKEMKSDVHNLFLCNSKLNTYRSNFRYVKPIEYLKFSNDSTCNVLDMKGNKITSNEEIFSHAGYLMAINSKRKVFVPTDYSRGKIARAIAYFSIKYGYEDKIDEIIDLKTLIEWNLKDPVDNEEYLKNIICYRYQGNLNPFIMDPDLVYLSFMDKVNIEEKILRERQSMKIDPLYAIDYLVDEINIQKNDISKLVKIIKNK